MKIAGKWLDRLDVEDESIWLVLLVALSCLYVALVFFAAWLSDDAYITFRTIDNFINGFGLRWNVDERVQSYTHPLWLLVLSAPYSLTGEIYFTSLVVSMLLSFAAVGLALRLAVSRQMAVLGLLILLSSRAFIDYTTSGLETPLSYFLAATFFSVYFGRIGGTNRLFWLSLIASLAALNRLDTSLIYAPAVLVVTVSAWRSGTKPVELIYKLATGASPLIVWFLFSYIYYGFPFPNTYYAKLWTGIAPLDLFVQGLRYAWNSLTEDTLTLAFVTAMLASLFIRSDVKSRAAGVGVLLYLLYTLKIGGDFMSGRFFALPLLIAVMVVGLQKMRPSAVALVAALSLIIGLLVPRPSLLYFFQTPEAFKQRGLADERGFYYAYSGLMRREEGRPRMFVDEFVDSALADRAMALEKNGNETFVVKKWNIGYYGYFAGANVHVIDELGLADPLLARLPIIHPDFWTAGHYSRAIPDGYEESIRTGENLISDTEIAILYDDIKLITRGPIFSRKRFGAILRQNLGQRFVRD